MKIEDIIRVKIKELVTLGEKNFVIAPMGKWGKVTKCILNKEFGIEEKCCLDNGCFDERKIYKVMDLPIEYRDCCILLAIEDEWNRFCMQEELKEVTDECNVKVIVNNLDNEIFYESDKVKLNFLCVGFPKCGTSSLHTALKLNKHIFLPKIKETHLMINMNSKQHMVFRCWYKDSLGKSKLVGGIEPTYFNRAESVYNYFGKDIKLVFCISNPIKALFSHFKMEMRMGNSWELIKRHGVSMEGFKEWYPMNLYRFRYVDFIKFYLKYSTFPPAQLA